MRLHNLSHKRCRRRLAICAGNRNDAALCKMIGKFDLSPDMHTVLFHIDDKIRINRNTGA